VPRNALLARVSLYSGRTCNGESDSHTGGEDGARGHRREGAAAADRPTHYHRGTMSCRTVHRLRECQDPMTIPPPRAHSWSPEAPQQTRPWRWARSSSLSTVQTAPTAPQTISRICCSAQKVSRACGVLRRPFPLCADMARRSRQRCQCAHDRARRAAEIYQSRARPSVGRGESVRECRRTHFASMSD